MEATLSCTAGEREVYALVNAPDYSSVPGKAALLAKVSELSANSLTNFEMVGSKSVTLPQASSVSVDVNRIAARVVIKQITRKFSSAALQALDFSVDAIYLINVAGNTSNDLTAAPAAWYNVAKNNDELPALLGRQRRRDLNERNLPAEKTAQRYGLMQRPGRGAVDDVALVEIAQLLVGFRTHIAADLVGVRIFVILQPLDVLLDALRLLIADGDDIDAGYH
jgi:hypothetical protein